MMDGKAVRQKLIGSDDQRAVSPVIGVILMVAITVILAAVIAAFVLDMGGSQSAPAQAGVSVDETDDPHVVTIQSIGGNTQTVKCSNDSPGSTGSISATEGTSVGDEFVCGDGDNIIAVSDDGNENIIQQDI